MVNIQFKLQVHIIMWEPNYLRKNKTEQEKSSKYHFTRKKSIKQFESNLWTCGTSGVGFKIQASRKWFSFYAQPTNISWRSQKHFLSANIKIFKTPTQILKVSLWTNQLSLQLVDIPFITGAWLETQPLLDTLFNCFLPLFIRNLSFILDLTALSSCFIPLFQRLTIFFKTKPISRVYWCLKFFSHIFVTPFKCLKIFPMNQ